MPQAIFAYHLGMDAEQYAFFRIPKLLITEPYFRRLSTDAKLLYGLMLDRMSLSMRNGWMDDDGHVYIYFTLEEACEQLCCKTDKAVKLFAELDSAKGVGLIRRVKQGLGRPAKIYVLRFMGIEDEPGEDTPEPELPSCRNPDFGKTEVKSSEKPKSGPRKIRSQDLGKTECNKTDKNNTELNNTDSSIHPGAQPEEVIEGYRKEIRENIEYDHLRRQHPYDDIDEIADLMLEVPLHTGQLHADRRKAALYGVSEGAFSEAGFLPHRVCAGLPAGEHRGHSQHQSLSAGDAVQRPSYLRQLLPRQSESRLP